MRKLVLCPLVYLMALTVLVSAQQPEKLAEKNDAAGEIAALRTPYLAGAEAASADLDKWKASLEKWYNEGLAKLLSESTAAGDLDGTLAVKTEQERRAKKQVATEAQVRAMPELLLNLRMTYEVTLKKLTEESERRRGAVRQKLLDDLEALQKRITMTGDIEQAVVVKTERDRRKAEFAGASAPATTVAQPPPPKPATPSPSIRPPQNPEPISRPSLDYAKLVPGKPGFVQSPYAPESGYVDVRGYAPGSEVKDPFSGKMFLVPAEVAPWEKLAKGETPVALSGTWTVEDVGNRDKKARYLLPKGALLGQGIAGTGDWRVIEGRLILTFPNGDTEEMPSPIDPKGTKGVSGKGRVLQAVKEKSELPWPASRPASLTGSEATALAGEAAVKALVGGSRWAWYDIQKTGQETKHWHEFYRDGSAANSWGRRPLWETLGPTLLHIYDAYDNRHWYLDVDVGKREATKNAALDHNNIRMSFDRPAEKSAQPASR